MKGGHASESFSGPQLGVHLRSSEAIASGEYPALYTSIDSVGCCSFVVMVEPETLGSTLSPIRPHPPLAVETHGFNTSSFHTRLNDGGELT
jgi:hypothetical protein